MMKLSLKKNKDKETFDDMAKDEVNKLSKNKFGSKLKQLSKKSK